MSHSFLQQIRKANEVAITCWRAADSCNDRLCQMARREEAEYERKYGVTWREMATVNYNDYLNQRKDKAI
jgi:hypothetical protein